LAFLYIKKINERFYYWGGRFLQE